MVVRIVDRDIVQSSHHHIIIQQVNCQGKMASGLALNIAKRYPFVRDQYERFCNDKKPEELLGNCLLCSTEYSIRKVVCNFSQLEYGRDSSITYTDYDAVRECFKTIAEHFNPATDTFAIPYRYGCGLGNASWVKVSRIIEEELGGFSFVYYRHN